MEDVNKRILVRGLGLSALGKLDNESVKIAARLEIPNHEGAGGIEDFADKESFQKHVKRVRNRKKERENNQHYSTKRVKKITSAT